MLVMGRARLLVQAESLLQPERPTAEAYALFDRLLLEVQGIDQELAQLSIQGQLIQVSPEDVAEAKTQAILWNYWRQRDEEQDRLAQQERMARRHERERKRRRARERKHEKRESDSSRLDQVRARAERETTSAVSSLRADHVPWKDWRPTEAVELSDLPTCELDEMPRVATPLLERELDARARAMMMWAPWVRRNRHSRRYEGFGR